MTKLDRLPYEDKERDCLRAVVETPRGSRNKLDYNTELGVIELDAVLPEGTVFPYDFGFFPSTKAEDGDPLDVMVLMDETVAPGTIVPVRLIGAIEAEQRKKGEDWIRNDRLLAVADRRRCAWHGSNHRGPQPEADRSDRSVFRALQSAEGLGVQADRSRRAERRPQAARRRAPGRVSVEAGKNGLQAARWGDLRDGHRAGDHRLLD